MKRYFAALAVLLMSIGFAVADPGPCADCNVNSITQDDTQVIKNVFVAAHNPVIYNEGVTAAVTITPSRYEYSADYIRVGFSKTEQTMTQCIDGLGTSLTSGVPGLFANKAAQAAWTENQGAKEKDLDTATWDYEGALIKQDTVQNIKNIRLFDAYDWTYKKNGPEGIFNGDSKLAVISDNLRTLSKSVAVGSTATDTATSSTSITNAAGVTANVDGGVTTTTP